MYIVLSIFTLNGYVYLLLKIIICLNHYFTFNNVFKRKKKNTYDVNTNKSDIEITFLRYQDVYFHYIYKHMFKYVLDHI